MCVIAGFLCVRQDGWSPLVAGLPSLLRLWNQHAQLHRLCEHQPVKSHAQNIRIEFKCSILELNEVPVVLLPALDIYYIICSAV